MVAKCFNADRTAALQVASKLRQKAKNQLAHIDTGKTPEGIRRKGLCVFCPGETPVGRCISKTQHSRMQAFVDRRK